MIGAVRVVFLLTGVWLGWHGISLLLAFDTPDLLSIVLWFSAGILLHDAVFAPLSAAVGLGARRILPARWWAPAACGAVCSVALALIALPVIGRQNARPDNPTVLDRDYPTGLTIALIAVWALVLVAGSTRSVRRGRAGKARDHTPSERRT